MPDISLRAVRESDLPVLFGQQQDPVANEMAAFAPRDEEAFFAHWQKVLEDDEVVKKTILVGAHIAGYICCFEREGRHLVGYWIGRDFWGKGIASRALEDLVATVKTRPLHAYVAKHNVGSIRVLEKCGFVVSGESVVIPNKGDDPVEEFVYTLAG